MFSWYMVSHLGVVPPRSSWSSQPVGCGVHCGCMYVLEACIGNSVGASQYLLASNLPFLQVTLMLSGGLLMCLNTYCLSFSPYLSNLIIYPSPLPPRKAVLSLCTETTLLSLVCLLALLCCCYWCHLWGQGLFLSILDCYSCIGRLISKQ